MAPFGTNTGSNDANNTRSAVAPAAPQPIPISTARQQPPSQSNRRSSFGGWTQSLFGMSPPEGSRIQTGPKRNGLSPSAGYSAAGANSLPDAAASSAFSGIGLFRRFSTASTVAAPTATPTAPSYTQKVEDHSSPEYKWIAANSATLKLGESIGVQQGLHAAKDPALSSDHQPQLQPKFFEEIRTNEDPPSRPDSRMRNLMLSGQFLI
ncbi:hypothetical protein LPJ66_005921 [Kickxella alabastrina]|uniref:Uncharacterized protein n=1 Tax=Kickxella alabastrina TaxID=61397 RepID=A0ACC1IDW6_9FUNG|nr:hypothetical protein LPJ66_005921 [Kickxella alabastrina]